LGIKAEDKKHLFKAFGYVENNRGLNKNGVGLGLVILNQITKQFDGEIKFKDTVGGGSTFYFSIELDKYTTERD
jgi:K+-sensing histidine kinase KdpD